MNFRQPVVLGRTGLEVSRLGIGAGYGVSAQAIEKAYHEYGINYFCWGSLRRSGMKRAIVNLARSERSRMVIAMQSFDRIGTFTRHFFERGLKALGLDWVDVLILGMRDQYPGERIMEAVADLKRRDKFRFLALSAHHRPFFQQLLERNTDPPVDIFMIRYNAAHRGAEQDVFDHLPSANRPGITCFTATRWGHLLKPRRMPPGEKPLTAAQCYRFVLSNPHVDLCLTGPSNARQMDEALTALDAGPLDEDEIQRVKRIGDYVHSARKGPMR